MKTYAEYVEGFLKLREAGRGCPLGGFPFPTPTQRPGGPKALLFSPHPDDECIFGGFPLRLKREANFEIVNVAVTQGSNKGRQAERLEELSQACRYLDFGLVTTRENGLEKITLKTRDSDPAAWSEAVGCVEAILRTHRPAMIFIPHERDANSTHEGTNLLVMAALRKAGMDFPCRVVETEFWAPMAAPNLMIEIPPTDLASLLTALSFHVGEVSRNPYHLSLPAWMMDNVRRGGEVVGGQGGAVPDFPFATLYRMTRWNGEALEPVLKTNRVVPATDSVAELMK
ncbi:MAG: PIG-L family deacetylase [Kiritimatiellia bacterium]